MKKIKEMYMPSMDELYQMQDMGANVYKYLVVKAVESLVLRGINSEDKEILGKTYKYFREDPYIANTICWMYPSQLKYSETARNDAKLYDDIMKRSPKLACNLDFSSGFDNSLFYNYTIIATTIAKLEEELKKNPAYRFEYKDNILLDRIFSGEIKGSEIMFNKGSLRSLLNIEPAYGVLFSDRIFDDVGYDRKDIVCSSVNNFAGRYNIPSNAGDQYFGKDILTNPGTEVKRLIRCINRE